MTAIEWTDAIALDAPRRTMGEAASGADNTGQPLTAFANGGRNMAADNGSTRRHGAQLRDKNHQWKGGRLVASNGYVLVKVGVAHHLADVRGYAYEHRLEAEKMIGRRLKDGEVVHHKDGDKTNNAPANLEVCESIAHHRAEHRAANSTKRMPGEPNPVVLCACGCGISLLKYDRSNRPRQFVSGHNMRGASHV